MTVYEAMSLKYMWWQDVIAIGGFALTIISLLIVYYDYSHRKSKEEADKAIEVAKYFMDEILPGLSAVNELCFKGGIRELLNKHKFYEYEEFDEKELNDLYSQKEIQSILKVFKDTKISNKVEENDEKTDISLGNLSIILLNRLEYMCMCITSEIADDEYIYKSLHQMLLNSVQALYVNIAQLNVNEKDKYYTNVIEVYNKWKDKYFMETKREDRLLRRMNKKIKKIKKKFKKHKKIS